MRGRVHRDQESEPKRPGCAGERGAGRGAQAAPGQRGEPRVALLPRSTNQLCGQVTIDEGLYLCNLICMFIVLHAFDASGFGSAAKYVFATEIAGLFENNAFVGMT